MEAQGVGWVRLGALIMDVCVELSGIHWQSSLTIGFSVKMCFPAAIALRMISALK